MSFLYFHWLFPLSARENSLRRRSIYKSTQERVYSKGLFLEMEAPSDRLLRKLIARLKLGDFAGHVKIYIVINGARFTAHGLTVY